MELFAIFNAFEASPALWRAVVFSYLLIFVRNIILMDYFGILFVVLTLYIVLHIVQSSVKPGESVQRSFEDVSDSLASPPTVADLAGSLIANKCLKSSSIQTDCLPVSLTPEYNLLHVSLVNKIVEDSSSQTDAFNVSSTNLVSSTVPEKLLEDSSSQTETDVFEAPAADLFSSSVIYRLFEHSSSQTDVPAIATNINDPVSNAANERNLIELTSLENDVCIVNMNAEKGSLLDQTDFVIPLIQVTPETVYAEIATQTELETVSQGTDPDPFVHNPLLPLPKRFTLDDTFIESERLCDELERLHDVIRDLETVRDGLTQDVNRLEFEKQKLMRDFMDFCQEMDVKRDEDIKKLHAADKTIQELTAELQTLRNEMVDKDKLIEELRASLNSAISETENNPASVDESTEQLKEQIGKYEAQIAELEDNVIAVGEENQRLQTQSCQIECLKGELEDIQRESGEKDEKIAQLMELLRSTNQAVKSQTEGLSRFNFNRTLLNESTPGNILRDATTSPFSTPYKSKRTALSPEKADAALQTDLDTKTFTDTSTSPNPLTPTRNTSPTSRSKRKAGDVDEKLLSADNRKKTIPRVTFAPDTQSHIPRASMRRPLLDSNPRVYGSGLTYGRFSDVYNKPGIPATPITESSFSSFVSDVNQSGSFSFQVQRPKPSDYPPQTSYADRLMYIKSGAGWKNQNSNNPAQYRHSDFSANHPIMKNGNQNLSERSRLLSTLRK